MFDLGLTFLQSAERRPDATALVDGDLRMTYAQWARRIGAVQSALTGLGLRRGEHIVAAMQNTWQLATLHWACQFAGIVITPINWRAKSDELDYCLTDSAARAMVFDAAAQESVVRSVEARRLPCIRAGISSTGAGGIEADDRIQRFESWLASPRWPVPMAQPGDLSLMLYTSGTTGRPKGVPRRHRAERMAALAHVAQNCYAMGERTLGVMPLYHTMGVRSLLASALVDGCYVCQPRFDAGAALRAIETERISHLYLVPTLYHDLLAHREFRREAVRSVRKLGFAGAPMHAALLQRLKDAFAPDLLVNHYGSSEIYTFSIHQQADLKPGSAGRAGLNARLRIVPLGCDDPAQPAPANEEGQIIADLAGDEAFEGYHNRPDADARSLRQGWYFTGDTGYFDTEGDLFVTGRVDDMIISGGENISPVEIESVLSLHPWVDEVAVAGLPDPRWGQKVVAFVKPRADPGLGVSGNEEHRAHMDVESLDRHCRASGLANFKRPREFVLVRDIPKSPVGKILRRKLIAGEYEHYVHSHTAPPP